MNANIDIFEMSCEESESYFKQLATLKKDQAYHQP
jgi:hypothetical protein